MRPQRGKRGDAGGATPGLVAQFFDFLVPPEIPCQTEDQDRQELCEFARVMQCAENWRELRSLVETIGKLMDGSRTGEGDDGYATFFIERGGKHLLMGIRANEAGDELHITQHIMNRGGGLSRAPAELRLVFKDLDAEAKADGAVQRRNEL